MPSSSEFAGLSESTSDASAGEPSPAEPSPPSSRGRIPRVAFWAQILLGLVLGVLLGWVARSGDITWLGTALTKTGGSWT